MSLVNKYLNVLVRVKQNNRERCPLIRHIGLNIGSAWWLAMPLLWDSFLQIKKMYKGFYAEVTP